VEYHSTYTPSFSPEAAEDGDLKALYYATAQSIRDTLTQRWIATYERFKKTNQKEVAYLSMEFLQVRRPGRGDQHLALLLRQSFFF